MHSSRKCSSCRPQTHQDAFGKKGAFETRILRKTARRHTVRRDGGSLDQWNSLMFDLWDYSRYLNMSQVPETKPLFDELSKNGF